MAKPTKIHHFCCNILSISSNINFQIDDSSSSSSSSLDNSGAVVNMNQQSQSIFYSAQLNTGTSTPASRNSPSLSAGQPAGRNTPSPTAVPRPTGRATPSPTPPGAATVKPPPKPVPRKSKMAAQQGQGQASLMDLDSGLNANESKANSSDPEITFHPRYTDFDPLSQSPLDLENQGISMSTPNIPDNANNNKISEQTRNVIMRQHPVEKDHRPSVKRRSMQLQATNQQTMKEARTNFIQTETKPDFSSNNPADSNLDIFDPLADSDTISVTSMKRVGSGVQFDSAGDNQDDLLKEWNLDSHFNQMKINNPTSSSSLSAQHPALPPKVPDSGIQPTVMGGTGFGGYFSQHGTAGYSSQQTGYGMGGMQQQGVTGVPRPYPGTNMASLMTGVGGYNRSSMPPLSSSSPIHAQLAALGKGNNTQPPVLVPLSQTNRAPSVPSVPSRESRGTSPSIAQTIANLNDAAQFHGNTKPRQFLPQGSVKKVITNIETTHKNVSLLDDLSFLDSKPSGVGANVRSNTPSPSLQQQTASQSKRTTAWETFD